MGSKSKLSHEIRPQIKREALYKLTPIYHKTAIGTWFKSLKTRLCILRSIFILFRFSSLMLLYRRYSSGQKNKNKWKNWTLAITTCLFLYKNNWPRGFMKKSPFFHWYGHFWLSKFVFEAFRKFVQTTHLVGRQGFIWKIKINMLCIQSIHEFLLRIQNI